MLFLDQIQRTHESDGASTQPVAPSSFRIEREEIFGVIGFSGAGKEILPRLVELIDEHGGRRTVARRKRLVLVASAELWAGRRPIGMLSQHFNLLHHRSALANVSFPLEIGGVPAREVRSRAAACLEWVGLADKSQAYPAQLSDAEKRLVTLARALAPGPEVLLCDEPTATLEPQSANRILSILQAVNRDFGVTILIATRSLDVVRRICHAVAVIEAGFVVEQLRLADLYAAPQTRLGRLLFTPCPPTQPAAQAHRCTDLCLTG